MVKIELEKRDFAWLTLLIFLVGISFVYGYNSGADPSAMGHSSEEIVVDDALCKKITGHGCGVDNTGPSSMTESDPTVPNNLKNGVSWNEIGGSCPCGTCWVVSSYMTCSQPSQSDSGKQLCTPRGNVIIKNQVCGSH